MDYSQLKRCHWIDKKRYVELLIVVILHIHHLCSDTNTTYSTFPLSTTSSSRWFRFINKQIISPARELTPFYASQLAFYKEANPNSTLGEPGSMQGVNTGVMLLRLDRMRQSHRFNQ